MNNLVDIVTQYWGIITAFIVGIIYVLTHYNASIAYARKKAVTLMLAVEKRAEDLLLADGPAKLAWVVDKGYDMLPAVVRIVVSKPLFKAIAQELFDSALAVAKAHVVATKTTDASPPQ